MELSSAKPQLKCLLKQKVGQNIISDEIFVGISISITSSHIWRRDSREEPQVGLSPGLRTSFGKFLCQLAAQIVR
jgi:hypothetical protein